MKGAQMSYAPAEVRHVKLKRGLFGYQRTSTDRVLTEVAESFEEVWRERADLADKVEQLEQDLVRHRELETLLRKTLVSAERTAEELVEQARREAALIVSEAHAEARRITHGALAEHERLAAELRRTRELLRSALATLDETGGADEVPDAQAA